MKLTSPPFASREAFHALCRSCTRCLRALGEVDLGDLLVDLLHVDLEVLDRGLDGGRDLLKLSILDAEQTEEDLVDSALDVGGVEVLEAGDDLSRE